MTDSNLSGTSQCYVRWNRRYTVSGAVITVFQSGTLVTVANADVQQLVKDGILHPPGSPYVPGPVDINAAGP